MCLEKRRGGPYIGTKKEENPTSNRCGIHICKKSNIFYRFGNKNKEGKKNGKYNSEHIKEN